MMTATGGNTGSQAATVVIRAMALDEMGDKSWLNVIWKEFRISFLLSLCVGGLVFIKVAFLTSQGLAPEGLTLLFIGFIVGLAMAVQVISSAIIGAGLPLLAKKIGGDPAVAASPAITTLVDITGLLIYFTVASLAIN